MIRALTIATLLACLAVVAPGATAVAKADGATLERVVIVMRHGIKRPNSDPPLPQRLTPQVWPVWPVPPAALTPHGEQAIARIADFDRLTYAGLLGPGCPAVGTVRIVADTDQRTIRTAEVYANTAFKGCDVPVANAGEGQTDARFSPFNADVASPPLDGAAVREEALASGDMAAIDTAHQADYALLDQVLELKNAPGCRTDQVCSLNDMPSGLDVGGRDPKVSGALKTASSLSQILMLEYANGFPMSDVGWGRVSKRQITALSALHAEEFRLIARPKAVATYAAAGLLSEVRSALFDPEASRYTLLVGHDGNLAYIGGALGLHWQAQGFAADDPPPGGALVFELWRDGAGREFVRVRFRSSSLDGLRSLTPLTTRASKRIPILSCGKQADCGAAQFRALLP
ncbi:histidine-type phosphatase [Asticcacaulis sp. 201]|uniref:histidine-type phosphatase n=1 Tax=Asticcacaulis sp. 201 TaxID=3028787 RepID=UPI002915E4FF|nr:histidine-type phosphatase [Asticcacaulis sp. 201]MDV6330036.1 histidine-type phosphatase [Asticcacaulis sp. 201]